MNEKKKIKPTDSGKFNDPLYYPETPETKDEEISESNQFGREEFKEVKVSRPKSNYGWEGQDPEKPAESKRP